MKYHQLLSMHREILKQLSRPKIRKILLQHPDADWSVSYHPHYHIPISLTGNIYLSAQRVELDLDITEIANGVDATDWNYIDSPTIYEDDQISIDLSIVCCQPLRPDEKDLLRNLGNLQTIRPEPEPYEAVVCNRPAH